LTWPRRWATLFPIELVENRTIEDLAQRDRPVLAAAGPSPAAAVAAAVRSTAPDPRALLGREQRRGSADGYCQHVLHVEPDRSFSIVALVWRPGQATPVHDHVCWCVVAVVQGEERETLYEHRGGRLVAVSTACHGVGSVSACEPPGDIHRVSNEGEDVAISLHVYGADVETLGTSIRRAYEAPAA
jgi:predicted metal-dependent enzyme (double-stranded beta helix superfamily)